MQFENEEYKCKFEIPDRPTVRQRMFYDGKTIGTQETMYLRMWDAATDLITVWTCELFPNHKADLESVTDPAVAELLEWAGWEVWKYIKALESLPKN